MGNRSPSCSVLTRAQTASSGKSNTHDSVTVVHTASADRVAATDETTTSSTDVPEADAIVAICGLGGGGTGWLGRSLDLDDCHAYFEIM